LQQLEINIAFPTFKS